VTARYPLSGRMVPGRNGVIQVSTAECCGEYVVGCWIVFKAKAGRFCRDFCGTVALVMIDPERSSDSLGPSVDSPTAGEANELIHVRRIQGKRWWPWRSAEQLVTVPTPALIVHAVSDISHLRILQPRISDMHSRCKFVSLHERLIIWAQANRCICETHVELHVKLAANDSGLRVTAGP
jgi:hypothetical protein